MPPQKKWWHAPFSRALLVALALLLRAQLSCGLAAIRCHVDDVVSTEEGLQAGHGA